jgi:hypothetical protein
MSKRLVSSEVKRRKQRNSALIKFAIVFAFLTVVGFAYVRTLVSRQSLDSVTLCPSQPKSLTVLLVDVTDPMNLAQRQDFINQMETLIGQIPRHGKLVVTKVDPVSDRLLVPIISRCNPGSGADVSELTGNPQQIERARQDSFLAPLRNAFDTLLSASGANRSPILESVQSVVLTELRRPDLANIPKRLIIASDLLQNTTGIRFYGRLPEPRAFTQSQQFNRLRADLRGIDVELWMLQRDDSNTTQPRALPDLWDQIIETQRGKLTRLYVVSG